MAVQNLLVLLLFVASFSHQALGDLRNDWPCPNATDINPCVCTEELLHLNLDCSAVTSDIQLQNVFKAHFPFSHFNELKIIAKPEDPRIDIVTLYPNMFQNITFSNIIISHTNLEIIFPNVFDESARHLKTVFVTDNKLTFFPFDFVSYSNLTDLRVFRNNLQHMPEMISDTLTYLQVSYNPELMYSDYVLQNLPNLEVFIANDINLEHVGVKSFFYNKKLKYVDLSYNNLHTLYKDSFWFQSPIEELRLDNNKISTVEVDAIQGIGGGSKTFLRMHNNYVESLDQHVWENVFNSVRGTVRDFTFNNNPFICKCNILWLVSDDEHRNTIAKGAICEDTETDILDVDVDFLLENCPEK